MLPHESVHDEAAAIITAIVQQTGANRGCILLHDNAGQFTFAAGYNLSAAEIDDPGFKLCRTHSIDVVLASGDPVVTTNAASDAETRKHQQGMRAILCAPLLREQELFGVLYVDSIIPAKIFTSGDLRPFVRLANDAALRLR